MSRLNRRSPPITHNLQLRDVLLPPDVLLVLGIEGGQQVVAVHHHVNKTVQRTHEDTVTPWQVLHLECSRASMRKGGVY